jgi:hypothetical protein
LGTNICQQKILKIILQPERAALSQLWKAVFGLCRTAAWPEEQSTSKVQAAVHQGLVGHLCAVKLQGYGLAWSGFREGYLLSGSDDAQICLWDINAANSKMLGAMAIYHQHLGVVEVTTYIVHYMPLV